MEAETTENKETEIISEQTPEKTKRSKFNYRQLLITLLVTVIVFVAVNFSVDSFVIEGASMEPSFHNGEYLVVSKLDYRIGNPGRGDVVVFHPPTNPNDLYIKRIIGLPGERVEIIDTKIYIDGKLLQEPSYISPTIYQGTYSKVVPDGSYFVLGDNRSHSSDSRVFGMVPEGNIVGDSWIIYWPISRWGLSPDYSWSLK